MTSPNGRRRRTPAGTCKPLICAERRRTTGPRNERYRTLSRHVSALRYSAARAPSAGQGGPARRRVRMFRPCWFPFGNSSGRPSAKPRPSPERGGDILEQHWIDTRIVRADLVRHMGDVELDRPTAARLEVDEEQAVLRVREGCPGCGSPCSSWSAFTRAVDLLDAARCSVSRSRVRSASDKRRGLVSIRDEPLGRCDSFREVRRLRPRRSRIAACRRCSASGVLGRRGGRQSHRRVVGPEGDRKVIALVHPRFDSRLKRRDGAARCGQPAGRP